MHLLCPNCQHPISVPDSSAGQSVECPLCGKPFPAPALSLYAPPTAPAPAAPPPPAAKDPEDDREPYGILSNPAPARPAAPAATPLLQTRIEPPPKAEAPKPPPPKPESPPSPPRSTGGGGLAIALNLPVIRIITLCALGIAFLLTFFPWTGSYPGGYGVYTQNAWQAMGGWYSVDKPGEKVFQMEDKIDAIRGGNWLVFFYLVLLLAVIALAVFEFVVPHLKTPLPPSVERYRPQNAALRLGISAGLIGLATVILLTQGWLFGFSLEKAIVGEVNSEKGLAALDAAAKTPEERQTVEMKRAELLGRYQLERTIWWRLTILAHVVALLGLAAEYWLVSRGNRPEPRFEFIW